MNLSVTKSRKDQLTAYYVAMLFVASLFLPASTAQAQDDEVSPWDFTISFPMIWVTDINGTIDVGDNRVDINTTFSETLDSLDFGYMAEFYAKKGSWQYALKVNYSESGDKIITREFTLPPGIPVVPNHKIKSSRVEGTTDLTVGYRFPNNVMLYTGVRAIYSEIDLSITPLGSGIIEIETSLNLVDEKLYDWLIGFEYRHYISPRWEVIFNADSAIAGDNDKDYLANAAFAFHMSKLNTLWFGYRYLRIADKFTEDDVLIETDFVTQGTTIGWSFTF